VNLRGYWGDLVGVFVSTREEKMRRGSGGVHLLLAMFFLFFFSPEIFVKWRFVFQIGMKN
jgi:hypothetical protein